MERLLTAHIVQSVHLVCVRSSQPLDNDTSITIYEVWRPKIVKWNAQGVSQ